MRASRPTRQPDATPPQPQGRPSQPFTLWSFYLTVTVDAILGLIVGLLLGPWLLQAILPHSFVLSAALEPADFSLIVVLSFFLAGGMGPAAARICVGLGDRKAFVSTYGWLILAGLVATILGLIACREVFAAAAHTMLSLPINVLWFLPAGAVAAPLTLALLTRWLRARRGQQPNRVQR